MIDDALLYEGVALPSAQGFGELAGRYLSALLSVIVDEGADFLSEFGYFFFGCGPEVEFYFDNLVVHRFQYYCHSDDRREEESRIQPRKTLIEILRFALDDKWWG